MEKPSFKLIARGFRVIFGLVASATLVSQSLTLPARATSPGVFQTVAQYGMTNAAKIVDLQTTPNLNNPPIRAINTLHNNISFAAHLAAKRRAAATPGSIQGKGLQTAVKSAPGFAFIDHGGITEATYGGFPPDGDIAVSRSYVLHIVNFGVTVYSKTASLLKRVNFATFFNNSTDFIFDPRAYWDPYWDRFVVMADGQSGSGSTAQSYFELAISTTNNPTGSYYIYRFSITGAGDFLDFPDLGMDQDSVIVTVNNYPLAGGFDAKVFALPKARMYSGVGSGFTFFGGIGCTVAPPYVLDNNPTTYILAACPNDNRVYLGAMTNSSRSNSSVLLWQAVIPVPAYTVSADAPQPGVDYALETGDNEFEQRSIQLGTRIWNVHTIQDGTATARWYDFDTSSNTLVSDGIWFASGTSSDWHPSIVMNAYGETFGTWMSVDASRNLNLSLHYNGGSGTTAGAGAGNTLHTSTTALTDQTFPGTRHRSGDFSYITIDPSSYGSCAAGRRAWLEGEVTSTSTNWGTRVGLIGNC